MIYRKTIGGDGGVVYVALSDEEEAAIRAAVVPDGSSGPLLFVENGMECLHSDEEAAAIRAEWAAAATAAAARVPKKVLRRQFLIALRRVGLRDAVDAAVAAADDETKDTYANALTFERDHDILLAMAAQLNVTDDQLDDLFRLAATL